MVRILYGVSGVGMGHAIRSKVILEELSKKHEVFVISSHGAYKVLKKSFKKVRNIEGFELVLSRNAILNFRTFIRNFRKASWKNYLQFRDIEDEITKFDPEVVISDWETYSSIYAKKYDVPLLSIDNGHFILFGKYMYPKHYHFQFVKAKHVLKMLMTSAQEYFVFCLEHSSLKRHKKVRKVTPVIRSEILKSKPEKKDYVLVYLTSRKYKSFSKVLKKIDEKFIVYGHEERSRDKNLYFKTFHEGSRFVEDLIHCKAVITSGGFTLISEALHLGKPLFVVPLRNHFEQLLNARYVQEWKRGVYSTRLHVKEFKEFFKNLDNYSCKKEKRRNNGEFFKVLEEKLARMK